MHFFHELTIFWSAKKWCKDTFFPPSIPFLQWFLATATVEAFVLLHNSRFNFHCYTLHEAMPTQKLAWKWRCNLSWLLAWKITKGIHSCKIASLNCLTDLVILSAHSNIYSKVKITKLKAKCRQQIWIRENGSNLDFNSISLPSPTVDEKLEKPVIICCNVHQKMVPHMLFQLI